MLIYNSVAELWFWFSSLALNDILRLRFSKAGNQLLRMSSVEL